MEPFIDFFISLQFLAGLCIGLLVAFVLFTRFRFIRYIINFYQARHEELLTKSEDLISRFEIIEPNIERLISTLQNPKVVNPKFEPESRSREESRGTVGQVPAVPEEVEQKKGVRKIRSEKT